jgi:hypothetical protein
MDQIFTPYQLDISAHLDAPDVLSSGKLCFEFANSAEWHAAEQPSETIHSYADLVGAQRSIAARICFARTSSRRKRLWLALPW